MCAFAHWQLLAEKAAQTQVPPHSYYISSCSALNPAVEELRFEEDLRQGSTFSAALPAALADAHSCRVLESHGDQVLQDVWLLVVPFSMCTGMLLQYTVLSGAGFCADTSIVSTAVTLRAVAALLQTFALLCEGAAAAAGCDPAGDVSNGGERHVGRRRRPRTRNTGALQYRCFHHRCVSTS